MTIYSSQMISGMVGQQLGMFAGYSGYAHQINPMMGGYPGMYPVMMPPMMPQLNVDVAMRRGMGSVYGEQVAMRMANVGHTAMGVGMAGLRVLSAFSPIPMDPISGGLRGLMVGGIGGGVMGAGVGAVAALPLYAATQAAQVYGGAFMGGMQDQAALNSVLRNNFQHFGGQGAFGRGFSQSQMGQIGQMISGELRRNPLSTAQELNQLIQGGAEAGLFTAVRDVQQFTQRFRTMLNVLRDVQRELGGTLTDALQFVRNAQQVGIFRNVDQVNFSSEMRTAEAVTGMDRNQLFALSAQGAQISRAFGGMGRQGAMGALRGAQILGAAIQSGVLNQEMLSEATGGLMGAEAIGAFVNNMLQRAGRFSYTGMGRFSLFALSNAEGTGLDADMMARFMAGDLSTGEVSRAAHRRVREMGRARALNREGLIRGAVMEEGGLAAQIGRMRLMIGDRVLDQSDDLASLVLQRRFRMSRPEAELMINLMRNQSTIATEEAMTAWSARRQTDIARDISENRSFDALMRQLEHGMSEAMGVARVRELGRNFMTRISALAERAMNDILGVSASTLTRGDEAALNRLFLGRASAADIARLDVRGASGVGDLVNAESLFDRPLAQNVLHALPFGIGGHVPLTAGEALSRRGVLGLRGARAGIIARDAIEEARQAQAGIVMGDSRLVLDRLEADTERTMRRITQAELMSAGLGDSSRFYQIFGGDANAIDAFMAIRGMTGTMRGAGGVPSLANVGVGGRVTAGGLIRDALRFVLGESTGTSVAETLGLGGGPGALEALRTPEENAAAFFAGGNEAFRQDMLRRSGGRTAADVRETIEYMEKSGLGDDAIRRTLAISENRAALLLEGVEGVDRSAMEAVLGSEEIQGRIRRILGAGEGLSDELEALRRYAGTLEDPAQRRAVESLAEQIDQGAGGSGEITGDLRKALESAVFDRRRIAEILTRRADMAAQYRAMARGISAVGGEGLSDIAEAFSAAGESLMGTEDSRDAIYAARTALSRMDTSSEDYRNVVSVLRRTEGGRALLSEAAQDRHMRRALSGGGRRGAVEAAETALGAITGGALSEMEFKVGKRTFRGDRRNAASLIASIFASGGRGAEEIKTQLITQLMGQLDMSEEEASNLVGIVSKGFREGRGGRMSESAIEELIRSTSSSETISRIQKEGAERMKRERDPLGHDRNLILGRMENVLKEIRDRLPNNSQPKGEER